MPWESSYAMGLIEAKLISCWCANVHPLSLSLFHFHSSARLVVWNRKAFAWTPTMLHDFSAIFQREHEALLKLLFSLSLLLSLLIPPARGSRVISLPLFPLLLFRNSFRRERPPSDCIRKEVLSNTRTASVFWNDWDAFLSLCACVSLSIWALLWVKKNPYERLGSC